MPSKATGFPSPHHRRDDPLLDKRPDDRHRTGWGAEPLEHDDDQIEYHYTKNRAILRRLVESPSRELR